MSLDYSKIRRCAEEQILENVSIPREQLFNRVETIRKADSALATKPSHIKDKRSKKSQGSIQDYYSYFDRWSVGNPLF